MGFKEMFEAAIEKTEDPLAPIKLEKAYNGAISVGMMFAGTGDQARVEHFSRLLLNAFPNDMDVTASDPDFICALASLFATSIEYFGKSLNKPTS